MQLNNSRGHIEMMTEGAAPFHVLKLFLNCQAIVMLAILAD